MARQSHGAHAPRRRWRRLSAAAVVASGCCVALSQRSLADTAALFAGETPGPPIAGVLHRRKAQSALRLPRSAWCPEDVTDLGVPDEYLSDVVQLTNSLEDLETRLAHPWMLVRFLTFAGNATAAEALVRSAHAWRQELHVEGLMHEWGEPEELDGSLCWRRRPSSDRARLADQHFCAGRVQGLTADGRPLVVARIGTWDLEGIVREELVSLMKNQFVFLMQDALEAGVAASIRERRLIFPSVVVDVSGISLSALRHLPAFKDFAVISNRYFPDTVETVTIVNAPMVFSGIWKVGSVLLAEETRRKFSIVGRDFSEGLMSHARVDRAALPLFLGGRASDDEIPSGLEVPLGAGASLDTSFGGRLKESLLAEA